MERGTLPGMRVAPFRAAWSDTLLLLNRELGYLGASKCIIEADFLEHEIRIDGGPKANARPRSPRVALRFKSRKHGDLVYRCDKCTTWQHNVRAIAKTLEWLRGAERYGVIKRGEQYTGFKALPEQAGLSRNGIIQTAMTVEEAARWLAGVPGWLDDGDVLEDHAAHIIQMQDLYRNAYRHAAKAYHPDTENGDEHQFRQLQEVKRVLDNHHAHQ